MSKRPLDPSNNEGPSQQSPTPSQTGGQAQSGAWGQVGSGGQGRSGGQAPGGGPGQHGGLGQGGGQAQVGQAQTQPWMQPRAGLRSSVLVQGAQQPHQVQPAQGGMRGPVSAPQTQSRGFSSSTQGGLSTQLGGLGNSMPSSQTGGYQRSSGGIPGPPPTKRINTGMTYIRA